MVSLLQLPICEMQGPVLCVFLFDCTSSNCIFFNCDQILPWEKYILIKMNFLSCCFSPTQSAKIIVFVYTGLSILLLSNKKKSWWYFFFFKEMRILEKTELPKYSVAAPFSMLFNTKTPLFIEVFPNLRNCYKRKYCG